MIDLFAAFPEKAVLKGHEACKEHQAGLQLVHWATARRGQCWWSDFISRLIETV